MNQLGMVIGSVLAMGVVVVIGIWGVSWVVRENKQYFVPNIQITVVEDRDPLADVGY